MAEKTSREANGISGLFQELILDQELKVTEIIESGANCNPSFLTRLLRGRLIAGHCQVSVVNGYGTAACSSYYGISAKDKSKGPVEPSSSWFPFEVSLRVAEV